MFEKINKAKARKLYAERKPFSMCACNLRPDMFGREINRMSFESLVEADFDYMVNVFAYYNCVNSETGRRVAFYVQTA